MELTFVAKDPDSVPDGSPALYRTDRKSWIVQGWAVTDPAALAALNLPDHQGLIQRVQDAGARLVQLKEGEIAGAALDVFETEPPGGATLSAPNIVLTPHIGGQTLEAQADATKAVGEKIVQFFRKERTVREPLSAERR